VALGGVVGMLAPFLFQGFKGNVASVSATTLLGALIGRAILSVVAKDKTL
jgi:uncharacterized membrane protein YeaQ/YmgE (transglycosylase-associated protein family)